MSEEPGKSRWEKSEDRLGSAASPGPAPPRTHPPRPLGAARVPREPAASARGRRGARTGDRGATPGIQISGRWLAVDFSECGLRVDVVLPVTASCGPREGQRAALGSRRPGRTDRRRKDRRTPRSWVSGAPVAGALGPLPRHPHAPRRLLRLPGSSPGSRPPAHGLGCDGRVPARARPLWRGGPGALPAWASSPATGFPATGFPATGCRWRRRSGARLPRAPAGALRLRGALGRRGCPESWGQCGQRWHESKRAPGHCGQRSICGGGGGGRSLPGQSPWWPPAVP